MGELATPAEFEAAAQLVDQHAVISQVVCGPDPDKYLEEINSFKKAGFDHVYIHQVGPDQEGFFRFYERTIAPRLH